MVDRDFDIIYKINNSFERDLILRLIVLSIYIILYIAFQKPTADAHVAITRYTVQVIIALVTNLTWKISRLFLIRNWYQRYFQV